MAQGVRLGAVFLLIFAFAFIAGPVRQTIVVGVPSSCLLSYLERWLTGNRVTIWNAAQRLKRCRLEVKEVKSLLTAFRKANNWKLLGWESCMELGECAAQGKCREAAYKYYSFFILSPPFFPIFCKAAYPDDNERLSLSVKHRKISAELLIFIWGEFLRCVNL